MMTTRYSNLAEKTFFEQIMSEPTPTNSQSELTGVLEGILGSLAQAQGKTPLPEISDPNNPMNTETMQVPDATLQQLLQDYFLRSNKGYPTDPSDPNNPMNMESVITPGLPIQEILQQQFERSQQSPETDSLSSGILGSLL